MQPRPPACTPRRPCLRPPGADASCKPRALRKRDSDESTAVPEAGSDTDKDAGSGEEEASTEAEARPEAMLAEGGPNLLRVVAELYAHVGGDNALHVKDLVLEFNRHDTISEVKAKTQDKEGISPPDQFICCNGLPLEDGSIISEHVPVAGGLLLRAFHLKD